jgi:hypothetical protein
MAGEFVDRPFLFRHGKLGRPGLIPGLRIFDRESIQDRFLVDPREMSRRRTIPLANSDSFFRADSKESTASVRGLR